MIWCELWGTSPVKYGHNQMKYLILQISPLHFKEIGKLGIIAFFEKSKMRHQSPSVR